MGKTLRAAVALAVTALLAAGCAEDRPPVTSSMTKAKIAGTVTFQGKPVAAGQISFNPANVERKYVPIAVAEIKDGKYATETLTGPNQVGVQSPELPRLFGASVDVKDGENPFDVDVK